MADEREGKPGIDRRRFLPWPRVQAPLNMSILSYRENKFARFDKEKQEIVL
jgi:hypothetical protein